MEPYVIQSDWEDLPTPEIFAKKIWSTVTQSLYFLVWVGLCVLPARCTNGHPWNPRRTSMNSCTWECKSTVQYEATNPENGEKYTATKFCKSAKKSWRSTTGSIYELWSKRVGPSTIVRILYWFSQKIPIEQLVHHTKVNAKALGKICDRIR